MASSMAGRGRIRLRRVFMFVGGGVVVNIAVAWGLVGTMQPWYIPDTRAIWRGWAWKDRNIIMFAGRVLRAGGGHTELHQCRELSPGGFEDLVSRYVGKIAVNLKSDVPSWSAATGRDVPGPGDDELFIVDEARGWPCMALRDRLLFRCAIGKRTEAAVEVEGGIPLPLEGAHVFSGLPNAHAIPIVPIWPGFAINTVFYAALIWFGVDVPAWSRRRLRVRRGRCPMCAYPIGAQDLCTECGAALPRRTSRDVPAPQIITAD